MLNPARRNGRRWGSALLVVAGLWQCIVSATPALALTQLQGAATKVGDSRGHSSVTLSGKFQRGERIDVHTAGVADIATHRPIDIDDHMRLASVSKAFSGAAALALVASGRLSLDDTIGSKRPDLPVAWWPVTLRQVLNHTSGLPDFTADPRFLQALENSLLQAPPPRQLLSFVEDKPLAFKAGSQYRQAHR
ncbi:MAG: beta-lactamase family protein [Deltaproteobacteria bacterium]|nr:beta-lactamase family protein [Deltaproteobacteria bacterium]